MISATILNIILSGKNISLQYVLTDDKDPMFLVQDSIPISLGWTASDIDQKMIPLIDAASYAQSLKPLLTTQIQSPNPIPVPISQIVPVQLTS